MSPDEQDAILGKTVREKDEIRRRLGVTDKLLSDIAAELKTFGEEILEFLEGRRSSFSSLSILHKYADFSRVINLTNERRTIDGKLQTTINQLAAMGITD